MLCPHFGCGVQVLCHSLDRRKGKTTNFKNVLNDNSDVKYLKQVYLRKIKAVEIID